MNLFVNDSITLRDWKNSDVKRLVLLANNEKIARNLMDSFPHPYTEKDAEHWISNCQNEKTNLLLAIEYKGEFVGGIGAHFKQDIHRYNAELGYWIGEPFWGKGIASTVLQFFSEYLFAHYKLNRIYGDVFSNNPASAKVLEKNGFTKEAVLKKAVFKNSFFLDVWVYSKLKS
jgi:RimJ/RimL family protein N-acetyltransferase